MAKIQLLVMCVCCWLWATQGQPQSCTCGFPTLEQVVDCSSDEGSNDELRIIPDLMFTCSGFITKWILSAQFDDDGHESVQLQVWRFINEALVVRTGSTTITVHTKNDSEIYEYKPETPLRVEMGDILGLFQPNDATLRVYETNDGPTNYVVELDRQPPPAILILDSADDNEALPLVTAEISVGTTTSLRLSPTPRTLIPHHPTATIPPPHPSQPSHPATNGSATASLRLPPIHHSPMATILSPHPPTIGPGESDNTLVKAIIGGVVGVVLSALIASVMALLFCIKRRRAEMAESKEEFETSTTKLRDKDYIHLHVNKAYVPTPILTGQNMAYGAARDYIIGDTQTGDEGYVVNQLFYEDTQSQLESSQFALVRTSDASYDYAVVTY